LLPYGRGLMQSGYLADIPENAITWKVIIMHVVNFPCLTT
jgi:hypothetical protein